MTLNKRVFLVALSLIFGMSVFASEKRAVVIERFTPRGCKVPEAAVERLHALLVDRISNTRKFFVYERDDEKLRALMKEIALADVGLTDGNAPQSNKLRACGYKILGNILKYKTNRTGITGGPFVETSDIEIQLAFLNIETAQRLATKTVREQVSVRSSNDPIVQSNRDISDEVLSTGLEKAACDIANQFVDLAFPITILSVNKRAATANVTMEQVKIDEIFEVYEIGDELEDPQTHEKLGFDEELVGRLKVSRPGPKTSKFVPVDEKHLSLEQVEKGMILRRLPEEISKSEMQKQQTKESQKRLLFLGNP